MSYFFAFSTSENTGKQVEGGHEKTPDSKYQFHRLNPLLFINTIITLRFTFVSHSLSVFELSEHYKTVHKLQGF